MRILGVDPGSRCTGYGIIDTADETAVAFGTIRLDADDSHPERLKQIYDALCALISDHAPEALSVEMPVYGRNAQSMLKLGRAQAVAMLAGLNAGLSVDQYTPAEVKKAVTGNGNASKKQVAFMVRNILSLRAETSVPHDASDALAIALCRQYRAGHGHDQTSYTGWASFVDNNPDRVVE
ncbi:crossover junction endodeoxyribonuclease RuvC [Salisaeta longa]|uniref:crossover junction endodeoxyribonuclease RuvC n=1 Tax=Salisaeta longa TaxID=503170 RepID=UPI0003B6C728|nr:crossover junction endodeoxyribonuclease RuvC [Salisaeta longa]